MSTILETRGITKTFPGVKALQGVSLRNVRCTFTTQKGDGPAKALRLPYPIPPTGEMLFTHFGVSGPLILTASLAVVDALRDGVPVVAAKVFRHILHW